MTDWIHCNKCAIRYRHSIKFFVSSCGHLVCDNCTPKSDSKCPVCKSPCDFIVLNNDLKPEMQIFFRPQSELIEKVNQVCTFQDLNKSALLKIVTDKYLMAKAELAKCYKALHDSKKEIVKLKAWIKSQQFSALSTPNAIFPSPSDTAASTFSNMPGRHGTPFMYAVNRKSSTPWNYNRTPMQQHSNANNSLAFSFQASLPDTTMNGTPASLAGTKQRRNSRPSAMMSISNLNLGVNKPR